MMIRVRVSPVCASRLKSREDLRYIGLLCTDKNGNVVTVTSSGRFKNLGQETDILKRKIE